MRHYTCPSKLPLPLCSSSWATERKDRLPLLIAFGHIAFMCPSLSPFPYSVPTSHNFSGGCTVPKLSRVPAFEMVSRKHKQMPEANAYSKSQRKYHESMPSSVSWFPTKKPWDPVKITAYHPKACRCLQSCQAWSDRPLKPDYDPQSGPACHQKKKPQASWPVPHALRDWPLAETEAECGEREDWSNPRN